MKAETRPGLLHHGTPALFHEGVQYRVLSACVGVSLALHVAALFAFPGLRPSVSAGGAKPLTATFSSTLARPEALTAAPKPLSRSRREVNFEAQPQILATSGPAVPDVPQPAEPISLYAPVQQTAGTAPPATDTSGGRETPATLGRSTEKYLAEAADTGLLEKYRLALIDAAKRYKRYPSRAIETGWQGRVEIRLVAGSDGTIKSAIIKRSSSYQILDDQALDMVKKSARAEPIPSALRGREFTLDIPVIFELQAG